MMVYDCLEFIRRSVYFDILQEKEIEFVIFLVCRGREKDKESMYKSVSEGVDLKTKVNLIRITTYEAVKWQNIYLVFKL